VFHRTGAFGLAVVVLTWAQFPLWLIGQAPSVYDGAAFGQHLFAIKNVAAMLCAMCVPARSRRSHRGLECS